MVLAYLGACLAPSKAYDRMQMATDNWAVHDRLRLSTNLLYKPLNLSILSSPPLPYTNAHSGPGSAQTPPLTTSHTLHSPLIYSTVLPSFPEKIYIQF